MMDTLTVTLIEPAKIDGRLQPAGTTLPVSRDIAAQLAAVKAIDPEAVLAGLVDEPLGSDFDTAIAEALADREVNWATALDHFETLADDRQIAALAVLKAEHVTDLQQIEGEFRALAIEDEQAVAIANSRVAELESHLLQAQSAGADKKKGPKPPTDPA